jgi:hypothetical protein
MTIFILINSFDSQRWKFTRLLLISSAWTLTILILIVSLTSASLANRSTFLRSLSQLFKIISSICILVRYIIWLVMNCCYWLVMIRSYSTINMEHLWILSFSSFNIAINIVKISITACWLNIDILLEGWNLRFLITRNLIIAFTN